MKKIVIAVDSFKGCLTSKEVGSAIEEGFLKVYPNLTIEKLSIADGGEGTVESLVSGFNGEIIYKTVSNPLNNPVEAKYGILNSNTAVIEMASASGLTLIPTELRNPLKTSTYGTGELIKDAIEKGCRNFLIGIGGSATNDAGLGMMHALGYKFFDKNGFELSPCGAILGLISNIDASQALPELKECKFTIACDVKNPFSGPQGAAYIFGRQKGADDDMIQFLDSGMKKFADTIKYTLNKDINDVPGAGAAGGMGGGFLAFLDATLKPGIDMVLDFLNFDRFLDGAELIITGEGKMDGQTSMGKAPMGVVKKGLEKNIPVIGIAGGIEAVNELNNMGVTSVFSITPFPLELEHAMEADFATKNITRLSEQLAKTIKQFKN